MLSHLSHFLRKVHMLNICARAKITRHAKGQNRINLYRQLLAIFSQIALTRFCLRAYFHAIILVMISS